MAELLRCFRISPDLLANAEFQHVLQDCFGWDKGRIFTTIPETDASSAWYPPGTGSIDQWRQGDWFVSSDTAGSIAMDLSLEKFSERHGDMASSWHVPSSVSFAREPAELAEALRSLLYREVEVIIVDPYFQYTRRRRGFVKTLEEIVRVWLAVNEDLDLPLKVQIFTRMDTSQLKSWLVSNKDLFADRVTVWPRRIKKVKFHNRFLLTSKSGIMFGWGLDTPNARQRDVMVRLDRVTKSEVHKATLEMAGMHEDHLQVAPLETLKASA